MGLYNISAAIIRERGSGREREGGEYKECPLSGIKTCSLTFG